ncbi:glutaminyl-peptide cyclotransferase [Nonlabens sp.]|uniref:glutaminyl-peptide cyclotransferase n=1 Tax=Nonlabens sp. TaxID=1888209 RepID=UPI001BCE8026|nr:glutaminyl-peptide cyclotransferase [Nonlabens sp.]
MKLNYFVLMIVITLSLSSCKTDIEVFKDNYELEITNSKLNWSDEDTVQISLLDSMSIGIDSVLWTQNAALIAGADGSTLSRKLKNQPYGNLTFKATVYRNGMNTTVATQIKRMPTQKATIYNYNILNTYVHDTLAYTQGLEFYGDSLYESTGQYKESDIRITDVTTGETIKKVSLPDSQFAEGMTILKDKVYQLTWQSKMGYVYDLDLNKIDDFKYNQSQEGWGLTNDGTYLYKSDGSSKIWKIDPNTYEELGYIEVVSNDRVVSKINELEWIDGKIYANVYTTNLIMIINPTNGLVEAAINLNTLKDEVPNYSEKDNVLNGIAYDKKNDRLFITGKRWPKMFEIEIIK